MSGQGVAGQGVLIQGGPVEFGTVTCDGQEVERTLTLVNPTDLPATFTAQMWDTDLDDVNFEVRPAQGAIAARGSVQVSVRRRDAHGPSGPREIDSAVRIVTTLAGHQDVRDVAVHEILSSAELRIVGDTDFGWLPANTVASAPVEMMSASQRYDWPSESVSVNGRCERSTLVTYDRWKRVPKRAACFSIASISSGPITPSGNPG